MVWNWWGGGIDSWWATGINRIKVDCHFSQSPAFVEANKPQSPPATKIASFITLVNQQMVSAPFYKKTNISRDYNSFGRLNADLIISPLRMISFLQDKSFMRTTLILLIQLHSQRTMFSCRGIILFVESGFSRNELAGRGRNTEWVLRIPLSTPSHWWLFVERG